jgi:hypothetical protein
MRYLWLSIGAVMLLGCFRNANMYKPGESKTSERILGERVDGPAKIYDAINGRVRFTLNDGARIETGPAVGKWMHAGLYVRVTAEQMGAGEIYPLAALISEGEVIGAAVDTLRLELEGPDSTASISGYVSLDRIKPNSIPERVLEGLLSQHRLSFDELELFIHNFGFEKTEDGEVADLTQYFIYQSFMVDPSPRDRITLIFDKNDFLVGIVHNNDLNVSDFKTYELIRGHKLTITAAIGDEEVRKLMDKKVSYYNLID